MEKINAPSFIYKILYGRTKNIPGRIEHESKYWNGIMVDKYIPDLALNELSKIDEIEIRSSCQGESAERPTFLIFRTKFTEEHYVKSVVARLNRNKDLKAGWDYGQAGLPRIGVTTNLWYSLENQKLFVHWWLSLPKKIKRSL